MWRLLRKELLNELYMFIRFKECWQERLRQDILKIYLTKEINTWDISRYITQYKGLRWVKEVCESLLLYKVIV